MPGLLQRLRHRTATDRRAAKSDHVKASQSKPGPNQGQADSTTGRLYTDRLVNLLGDAARAFVCTWMCAGVEACPADGSTALFSDGIACCGATLHTAARSASLCTSIFVPVLCLGAWLQCQVRPKLAFHGPTTAAAYSYRRVGREVHGDSLFYAQDHNSHCCWPRQV